MLLLSTDGYRVAIRPLLFRLPPETAQRVADLALKQSYIWRAMSPMLRARDARLEVDLCGMRLRNPVGLAAGYDKNCEFLPSMAALGFGYVTGGTVTEFPRPGNPRPRVLRYIKDQSLINSLGFPSRGLDFAARRLEKARDSFGGARVIVSVSGTAVDDIVRCHRRLEPLADAIEVNISSPNTAGLRVFQEPPALAELMGRLNDGRNKPLFVKLPPYPEEGEARDRVMELVKVCVEHGSDALTVANTRPAKDPRLAVGAGGLSGKLIFADMLRMVAEVRAEVGDRLAINACGGIFSGEDAWKALEAGATTVQLLTGLIYRGPGIVKRINEELLLRMRGMR
jgi:dihydroorotate dehydrogenase